MLPSSAATTLGLEIPRSKATSVEKNDEAVVSSLGSVLKRGPSTRVVACHCLELIPDRIVSPEFFCNPRGPRHRRLGGVGQAAGMGEATNLGSVTRRTDRKEQVMNLYVFMLA